MLPKRLFRKALSTASHPQPRVMNTDLAPISTSAIPAIKRKRCFVADVAIGPSNTQTTIIEQDHRAIKRRANAKQGFREFSRGPASDSGL